MEFDFITPKRATVSVQQMGETLRVWKWCFQLRKQDPKDIWFGLLAFNVNTEIHPWMFKLCMFKYTLYVWRPWWIQ